MTDLWFLLVLTIAVGSTILLAITTYISHRYLDAAERYMAWHEDFDRRLMDLLSSATETRSTDSPEPQPTSEETVNDVGAYGGAVTSVDYWSSQERDTGTTEPDIYVQMCADQTCQWFGIAHRGNHRPLPVMNDQWSHNR